MLRLTIMVGNLFVVENFAHRFVSAFLAELWQTLLFHMVHYIIVMVAEFQFLSYQLSLFFRGFRVVRNVAFVYLRNRLRF